MQKIKEYTVIGFIRRLGLENDNIYNVREALVENYLMENCKKWNLNFFIKLYQDYLMNRLANESCCDYNESCCDYVETLREFCETAENLRYIQADTIDKNPYLQPIFKNFVDYLKKENIYQNINRELTYIAGDLNSNEDAFIMWFEIIKCKYSKELIYEFDIYMRRYLYKYDKIQFERWISKNSYKVRGVILLEKFKRSNRKRTLLEFFDNIILGLEKYRRNDFPRSIILNNKLQNIKRIMKKNFFLMRILEGNWNNPVKRFDIERYYECKNHAVLLFEKVDRFKEFLNDYLDDLNNFTKDTLDIYFTQEDLKCNISGYQKLDELCDFKIEKSLLPCFVIWNHNSNETDVISLEDLSHQEIYIVIKYTVTELEKNDFDKSISNVKEKVNLIKTNNKNIVYNIYNNQIGAVGDGAIANNTTFKDKLERGENVNE